jgi:uncharacterized membrane protein YgdD (TMEM256/DUF423 family)
VVKTLLLLGSLFAFLAVACGAFGAHMLRGALSADTMHVFETGVRYHMYHALGIFIAAWLLHSFQLRGAAAAGLFFAAGIVLFSGSLYAMALTGAQWLGIVTPFGGLCFLLGWFLLGWNVWKRMQ